MGRVEGKVVIISGGASGIGRKTCKALVREGTRTIIADINTKGSRKVADDIGDNAIALALDGAKEYQWERCISECIRQFGRLDILVAGAGIGFYGNFEETTIEQWQKTPDVNWSRMSQQ